VLVAIFPEFLRNGFGAIATVAFNHTQIAILIFSDNRKLSLGHDVLPSWLIPFPFVHDPHENPDQGRFR
jgi:hypothetical protein